MEPFLMRSCLVGLTCLLLLALLPACAQTRRNDGVAEAVRDTFSAYRSAILSGRGDDAAALLSQSTYDYYDEMRRLALRGDADTVQALSLVNQMQVLMFRLRVPPEQLESLSPEALIAHAVDQGWIGKTSVLKLQPGRVESEGDVAILHAVVDGKDLGPGFRFNRERGAWRLDLVPTTKASNTAFQLAAKQQGISEREFMLVLMESVLGRKVGDEAWVPPRGAEPGTPAP